MANALYGSAKYNTNYNYNDAYVSAGAVYGYSIYSGNQYGAARYSGEIYGSGHYGSVRYSPPGSYYEKGTSYGGATYGTQHYIPGKLSTMYSDAKYGRLATDFLLRYQASAIFETSNYFRYNCVAERVKDTRFRYSNIFSEVDRPFRYGAPNIINKDFVIKYLPVTQWFLDCIGGNLAQIT